MKDIHNLVQKIKLSNRANFLEERVRHVLEDFVAEEGNCARVFTDPSNVAQCISFQTKKMREIFHVFPEVLMVDSTHGTNDSMYKLFGLMAHDCYENGQFVQLSLLDSESSHNMRSALSAFKESNINWRKVGVFVVSKECVVNIVGMFDLFFKCAV